MTALTRSNPGILHWTVEEYLTSKFVFLNGFRTEPETASIDAYGTVISYGNLVKAFDESTYTKEEWLHCVEQWRGNSYLSPIFTLTALWVSQLVDKKFGEVIN